MAEQTGAAFGIYPSSGRRPERLNQSRGVNAPLQLARGWAAGLLGLPGDIEGLVRMLPGIKDETPVLPTSDFYREYLPGYDPRPAARAMSGLGALTGGAGATSVVRGGLGAVKRATDLNAIRDYVRSAQGLSGLPGTAVVKPKGGNWISGAGSPEEAVRGLRNNRVEDEAYLRAMRAPEVRDPYNAWLGKKIEEDPGYRAVPGIQAYNQFAKESGLPPVRAEGPDAALNSWIDQKLAKYIRNEMGTPEDPLRALIQERGVSHLPLEQLQEGAEWLPDSVVLARRAAGFPEEGMALERHAAAGYPTGLPEEYARAAQGWEVAADTPITSHQAGDLIRPEYPNPAYGSRKDIVDMYLRENPWLAKVPPETPIYSLYHGRGFRDMDLGFDHLVDELRNAVREGSDLPAELRLRPEQLSKVSMPQAVELVDRINKWRAAQKAEADLARAGNAATVEYKTYDTVPGTALPNERGLRWVELKAGEDLPEGWAKRGSTLSGPEGAVALERSVNDPRYRALEDALKYEGETMGHCVGGYCPDVIEGRSRIFSLRDAKGQPHVTVEVRPDDLPNKFSDLWDIAMTHVPENSPGWEQLAEYGDDAYELFRQQHGRYLDDPRSVLEDILQYFPEAAEKTMAELNTPNIVQIKGKANKAPKDEYLPYVQDFVRSGRWGQVGDIQNTGMRPTREVFNFNELQMLKRMGEDYIPEALTGEDIQRLHNMIVPEGQRLKYDARGNVVGSEGANYARGGAVRAPAAGPLTYDPDRIAALAEQLTMEA